MRPLHVEPIGQVPHPESKCGRIGRTPRTQTCTPSPKSARPVRTLVIEAERPRSSPQTISSRACFRKFLPEPAEASCASIYDRLFEDADQHSARRHTLAMYHIAERNTIEEQRCIEIRERIHQTSQLCSDNRPHEKREAELIRKREEWAVKAAALKKERERVEMMECTFRPTFVSRQCNRTSSPHRTYNKARPITPSGPRKKLIKRSLEKRSEEDGFLSGVDSTSTLHD